MKALFFRGGVSATLLALAGLGVFLAGNEACLTRECVAQTIPFTGGELVGPDTWESSPLAGTWFHYPPAVALTVQIPQLASRTIISTTVYLSPSPHPDDTVGDNYAEASGNLAEFQALGTGAGYGVDVGQPSLQFTVLNGTCADYYARIVVTAVPVGFDAGAGDGLPDAGDDADATDAIGATDATDAAAD